jgi:phosphoribosylamine--glycine ligase
MTRAAVIGYDGRTSAVMDTLQRSKRIVGKVVRLSRGKMSANPAVGEAEIRLSVQRLEKLGQKPDFVVNGPEETLAMGKGVVDLLRDEFGIPCIGPTKRLAQLEASKAFTRRLLATHGIPGNPEFRIFSASDLGEIKSYLQQLGSFVVKPDGLTGGKGVKVSGEHLRSIGDAVLYCRELFNVGHPFVVIEEKLDGEEFSLQSFCDGKHVKHMPVVQDHKRAHAGDTGPNTGGMGSYSCEDHSLPFLSRRDLQQAQDITERVAQALREDFPQEPYKGILYGGFMVTRYGVRLIEYNARFGDPEALNVLSLLKTDFVDVCEAIIQGTLDKLAITFEKLATVCKYVVPEGYPEHYAENVNEVIDWRNVPKSANLRIFEAAVEKDGDAVGRLSGSRAVAFVGIGANVAEAERIAESAARAVKGPVEHRDDIGTQKLIAKRVAHMRALLSRHADVKYEHDDAPDSGVVKLVS